MTISIENNASVLSKPNAMLNTKNIKYKSGEYISIFHFLIALLLIAGYASETFAQDKFTIVGTWKVDVEQTITASRDANPSRYDSLSYTRKDDFRKSLNGRVYSFKEDGTIEIEVSRETETKTSKGKWLYNAETKSLEVILSKVTISFQVERKGDSLIILKRYRKSDTSILGDLVLFRSN